MVLHRTIPNPMVTRAQAIPNPMGTGLRLLRRSPVILSQTQWVSGLRRVNVASHCRDRGNRIQGTNSGSEQVTVTRALCLGTLPGL